MKPTEITKVLDLAKLVRAQGRTFIPLFAGDAGIGKSEICQAWAKEQQKTDPKFGFLDLRLAYYEGPDFVGMPERVMENGMRLTINFLPDFWPKEGTSGLLLLEEPNRAPSSTMNCIMQLLTDRRVDKYTLPEGWIIASAINPDNTNYDVNSMDTALANRFVTYNVEYDHKSFVEFMKKHKWHQSLISFVESGTFQFKRPDELGPEGKYISPRTLSQLNNAELAGLDGDLHYATSLAILGNAVGREYFKYRFEQTPVLAKELVESPKEALKRLKKYCGSDYKGDMVHATVTSVTDAFPDNIGVDLVIKVAKVLPKDQGVGLLKAVVSKSGKDGKNFLKLSDFLEKDPELAEAIKNNLRKDGPTKKKESVEQDDI